jgi:hypothetical protein
MLSNDKADGACPTGADAEPLAAESAALPEGTVSGTTLILAVEDLYNRLSARSLQRNPFWRALVDDPRSVPNAVYHGLCIENYHLLYRESYFDSPALSFPWSERVRVKFNEFYCEEFGHDRLLLKSLESLGLKAEMLYNSVPLRGTMALCNALSYWSRHDQLFFLTTLGPLEGRDVEIDSYVTAARAKGLPEAFVGPINAHANINKNSAHGLLTRELFAAIPVVTRADAARIYRQTELFVRIYDQFYTDVWDYYRGCGRQLLRPVGAI